MNTNSKSLYFGRDLEAMSMARNYYKWIITEFEPFLGNYVAEVGAGSGNFSELLIKRIKHLVAFEPSNNMYPLLKKRFAEDHRIKTVNNTFNLKHSILKEYFDSIVYINVLEHIEDDRQELSYIYKSLKNGGFVLLFVPALSCLYSNFDKNVGHFRRYQKNNLKLILKDNYFKIIKAKYIDFLGILPWYINFVLFNRPMTPNNVLLYDKLVLPIIQKIERLIIPPVGKNLLVVAQKI